MRTHHIEEVASRTLGEQFSCMYFQLVLSRLGTLETDDVLSKVYKMMKKIRASLPFYFSHGKS